VQRCDRDAGSVLVIAIVLVTIVGVIVVGALAYSVASLRATSHVYGPRRTQLYVADAANKAAMLYVGNHPDQFPYKAPVNGVAQCYSLTYGTVTGYGTVATKVCPQNDTTFVPSGSSKFAIITLGSGTNVNLKSNGLLNVKGNVYSHGAISTSPGTLAVTSGVVQATGGCSGTITVNGAALANCTVATLPTAGNDPAWVSGVTVEPTAGAHDACQTLNGHKVATLYPGYWTSASINTAANCSPALIWLTPGIYYIDGGWSIGTKVVAGTLSDTLANVAASSKTAGECDKTQPGVMLLIGGSSGLSLSKGNLQVCGLGTTQGGSTVKIPVYGLTADVTIPQAGTLTPGANPTNGGTPGTAWTSLSNGRTIDAKFALVSLAANASSQSINYTFTPASTVNGGKLMSLDVTAKVSSATLPVSFQVTVASGAKSCTMPASAQQITTTTVTKYTIDLSSSACPTPVASTALTVRLNATANSSAGTHTMSLDGIVVNYTSDIVTMPKLTSSTSMTTTGNNNNYWMDGFVYTPTSSIDVQTSNSAGLIITLGVVVQNLTINPTGSAISPPDVGGDQTADITGGDILLNSTVGATSWVNSLLHYDLTTTPLTTTIKTWLVAR
jgi:hypothetical protein